MPVTTGLHAPGLIKPDRSSYDEVIDRMKEERGLKKALFYTLASSWGGGRGYRVMAVTTEKRHQYFGRYVDHNEGTHRSIQECKGRFETVEAAEPCIQGVEDIRENHDALIKSTREALRDLERRRDQEVNAYMKEKGGV